MRHSIHIHFIRLFLFFFLSAILFACASSIQKPVKVSPSTTKPAKLQPVTNAGITERSPRLVIETGMHTARIADNAPSADGRYLITASVDKTARVWNLSTGNLVQTVYLPFGQGHEGEVYGAAVSPKGNIAAIAGWALGREKANSVYLFNYRTGKFLQRVKTDFTSSISLLQFFDNGRKLAVGTGYNSTIRVYEAPEYTLEKKVKFDSG